MNKYELVETDGGSIVFHIQKGIKTDIEKFDYISETEIKEFISNIEIMKEKLQFIISQYSIDEVVGYGAGAKGQQLIHFLELDKYISVVVDDTLQYENKYIPGTRVQIKLPNYLNKKKVKAVINLAPTHSEVIKSKVEDRLDFINIIN